MLAKIVSGGQTGVDRGALDAALERGFPCGGSCPAGRRAEDGVIPARYPLTELASRRYLARTFRNVDSSDGTLILHFGAVTGGTRRTLDHCAARRKPHLVIDASTTSPDVATALTADFVSAHSVAVLNVAGPRASGAPGAHAYAAAVIGRLLDRLAAERQTLERDARSLR